jgi:hypothetical protein
MPEFFTVSTLSLPTLPIPLLLCLCPCSQLLLSLFCLCLFLHSHPLSLPKPPTLIASVCFDSNLNFCVSSLLPTLSPGALIFTPTLPLCLSALPSAHVPDASHIVSLMILSCSGFFKLICISDRQEPHSLAKV